MAEQPSPLALARTKRDKALDTAISAAFPRAENWQAFAEADRAYSEALVREVGRILASHCREMSKEAVTVELLESLDPAAVLAQIEKGALPPVAIPSSGRE